MKKSTFNVDEALLEAMKKLLPQKSHLSYDIYWKLKESKAVNNMILLLYVKI